MIEPRQARRLVYTWVDIENLRFDLDKASVLREDAVLSRDPAIAARLQLAPLTLAENPGAQILRFISGDLTLSAKADAWDLFNDYLREISWLSLSGNGDLTATLSIDRGHLEPGSRLRLDSPSLGVTLHPGAPPGADANGAPRPIGDDTLYRLAGAGRGGLAGLDAVLTWEETGCRARSTCMATTSDSPCWGRTSRASSTSTYASTA